MRQQQTRRALKAQQNAILGRMLAEAERRHIAQMKPGPSRKPWMMQE